MRKRSFAVNSQSVALDICQRLAFSALRGYQLIPRNAMPMVCQHSGQLKVDLNQEGPGMHALMCHIRHLALINKNPIEP
jgi:hypothetical protein